MCGCDRKWCHQLFAPMGSCSSVDPYFQKLTAWSNSDAHWKNCRFWRNRLTSLSRKSISTLPLMTVYYVCIAMARVVNDISRQSSVLGVESHPSHHSEWADFIELTQTSKCLERIPFQLFRHIPSPTQINDWNNIITDWEHCATDLLCTDN